MTGLTGRPFLGTGTEGNALRAGLGRLGRARPSMGSRLGPEMTSRYHGNWDEPEMEKKSRDTVMDRFEQKL